MEECVKCSVCQQQQFKYKWPKCMIKYCTLPWFKQHQQVSEIIEAEVNQSECERRQTLRQMGKAQKQRYENNDETEALLLDDDDVVLKETELERIKENPQIMELLKSERLSDIIKRIDCSKNNKRQLDRELEKNEHFREFADVLLSGIGYLSESKEFQTPEQP